MADLNRMCLIGRLGADPEVKSFQNGGRICNLRVATSENWKDKQTGEKKERTEWHSVTLKSDGLVGVAERYLKKGSKVYLEGQLQTRKWQDSSGNDRYTTEIVLSGFAGKLIMLDAPGAGGGQRSGGTTQQGGGTSRGSDRSGSYGQNYSGGGNDWGGGAGSGSKGSFSDDLDDDIPF